MDKKLQKKLERKLKKYENMLLDEAGIYVSSDVTKNLAICNAGLVNGLSEEVVYDNFIKMGEIENIVMLPGKSFCFVQFENEKSSQKVFEQFNGSLPIAQDNKPIYLQYTKNIPDVTNTFNEHPQGLIIINDFINEDEEMILLGLYNFETSKECMTLKKRLTKSYGYQFNYDNNNVSKNDPLPENIPKECDFLWTRLSEKSNLKHFKPDQLTINYYKPGDGIAPHIDTHSAFEDPILSLSLGSSAVMEFKLKDKRANIFLPQRSLAILSGESRYCWSHAIIGRKYDIIPKQGRFTVHKRSVRTSFTFRKVLQGECNCDYPEYCDSYAKLNENNNLTGNIAESIEKKYVHTVYECIADHFDTTRNKPWPGVVKFLNTFDLGSIIIDVGCGNGKNIGIGENILSIGCDYSKGLLDVCKNRDLEVFCCNCLSVPLKDSSVDGAISIAVIHHLANYERRKKAIEEMIRILFIGGKGLIYVWAKDQYKKDKQKSKYIKQQRQESNSFSSPCENVQIENEVSLPVHVNRTTFQHQDMLVPWIKKDKINKNDDETGNCKENETYLRFYHTFEEKELFNMCLEIENIKIVDYYYDEGNWCCIFEKIK
nr:alkylated DNA repair protein alkB homolog 8 [Onthophagus taurus]